MSTAFSSLESAQQRLTAIADCSSAELDWLEHDWQLWARDDQLAPLALDDGAPWRTWLILGGRGAGKTRTGAEWVRSLVSRSGTGETANTPLRIALVGETLADARSVMVEGVSGVLAVHPAAERPEFQSSRRQLMWPNGTIAQLFSGADPDGLRGPQFDVAWCDEVAKWRHAEATWDMLQFALRLGGHPRQLVTTTPRPIPVLKRLLGDPATVVTRVRTADNAAHLAASYLAEMQRRYAGSLLGRQELDGEMIEEMTGALWRLAWIEQTRIDHEPELRRIVVAVDPPVTATATSDACGLVVAGLGEDGRGYVLADRTLQGREPAAWARAAVELYRHYKADRIVAEVNQGGDLVVGIIRQVDDTVPVGKVRATRGKWLRAEPVAALYAEGRVAHVGHFKELEQQMLGFGAGGLPGGRSPDRLDALVWALTDLMLEQTPLPSLRML